MVGDEPKVDRAFLRDPTAEQVENAGMGLLPGDLERFTTQAGGNERIRPRFEHRTMEHGDGAYLLGQFVVPLLDHRDGDQDGVAYQRIDFALRPTRALFTTGTTISSNESGQAATGIDLHEIEDSGSTPGEWTVALLEAVADRFERVANELVEDIDELEDAIDRYAESRQRDRRDQDATAPQRWLRELRRELADIRRLLQPTREAVEGVRSRRIDIGDDEVFPAPLEARLSDVDHRLRRAQDCLDNARDLLASSRDYLTSIEQNRQNEVVNRLTVVASVLLLPTLLVGLFGENFVLPGQQWRHGFLLSIIAIVVLTCAQLLLYDAIGWINLRPRRSRSAQSSS